MSGDLFINVTEDSFYVEVYDGFFPFIAQQDVAGPVEVVIPEGITGIEKDAFVGCSNLKRVILPDSITEIECWGDEKHAWSNTLFSPFNDLPDYLKEGREVDRYPNHWR